MGDTGAGDESVGGFDGTVASLPDPVCALDGDLRVARVNDAFQALTGYDRATLVGRSLRDLLAPGGAVDDRLRAVVAGERERARQSAPLVTRDGSRTQTELHASPRPDGDGCLCVFRRTDRREWERRRLETTRRVLTRVLRHNVRNELDVIKSHAEVVAETDAVAEHGEAIRRRSERLLAHSQKARAFEEQVGRDRLVRVDLRTVAEDAVAALDDDADLSVSVALDEPHEVVAHTDVAAAVRELLSNAAEHAPSGETPHVEIWAEDRGDTRTLFVEDTAGGISDHEIDVLRRGTETAFDHGGGVGLWLVRWLVDASGAELVAHTTREGSVFGIEFETTFDAVDRQAGDSPVRAGDETVGPTAVGRVREGLVGEREPTVRRLSETLKDAARVGGQTVLLTGEPGVGKTAVVDRFRGSVAAGGDARVVAGRCRPDATEPLAVFREAFDGTLGGDAAAALTEPAALRADDPETAERRRRALFSAVTDAVRAAVADSPVVLVLEDLHLADRESLALLEHLVAEVGQWGQPLFVLATAGVPADETPPDRLQGVFDRVRESRGEVVALERLDREAVGELLAAGLSVEQVPPSLVTAVHERTDGVPLLVQEVARQLADRYGTGDAEALPTDLSAVAVPASLESAVDARLSDLDPATETVVETGAVLGNGTTFDELRAATHLGESELLARIDDLVAQGLWSRTEARLAFRERVVRDQVRERLSPDRERTLHRRAIRAIRAVHDDVDRQAGRLATHHAAVGEHATAAEWEWRAGRRAARSHAYEEAVQRYEAAREHAGGVTALPPAFAADFARALRVTGEPERAQAVAARGLAVVGVGEAGGAGGDESEASGDGTNNDGSEASGDTGSHADGTTVAGRLTNELTEIQEAWGREDNARTAAQRQRAVGGPADRLDARLALASLDRVAGDWAAAREGYERALAAAREAGFPRREAQALNGLGTVAVDQSRHADAEARYEESLRLRRELDDRVGESAGLNNLGLVAYARNDQAAAADYFRRGLEIDREIGDDRGAAQALYNVAMVEMDRGDYETAVDHCRESLAIRRDLGDTRGEAECYEGLGVAHLHWGRYEEAREYFTECLRLRERLDYRYGQVNAHANLGEVAAYRGRYGEAQEQFETALAAARELDSASGRALAHAGLAETLLQRGAPTAAADHADEADRLAAEDGDSRRRMVARRARAAAARRAGDDRAARAAVRAARHLADDADDPRLSLRVHLEAGRVALADGDTARARARVADAESLAAELTVPYFAASVELLAGRVALADGETATGLARLREAYERFRDLGCPAPALRAAAAATERLAADGDTTRLHGWLRDARAVARSAPAPVCEQFAEYGVVGSGAGDDQVSRTSRS